MNDDIKDRLSELHQEKGIEEGERPVDAMSISELVLHVNELEDLATLVT